jgi:hypothetical protein
MVRLSNMLHSQGHMCVTLRYKLEPSSSSSYLPRPTAVDHFTICKGLAGFHLAEKSRSISILLFQKQPHLCDYKHSTRLWTSRKAKNDHRSKFVITNLASAPKKKPQKKIRGIIYIVGEEAVREDQYF